MHELAAFVAHAGRQKFSGYVGPINKPEWQKGLRDPVTANGTNDVILGWKMRGGVNPEKPARQWLSLEESGQGTAYFQTSFKLDAMPESGATYPFHTDALSHGCVWLNGRNVGRYPEVVKDCPGIWLPICCMKNGSNEVVVFDEGGQAQFASSVQLETDAS